MVLGIAHDSLQCTTENTGQNGAADDGRPACEEPSHHVLRLIKRDDELARRIAREAGMEIKVKFFELKNLIKIIYLTD